MFPVSTRRRFDVAITLFGRQNDVVWTSKRRCYNVKTTSCAYWVNLDFQYYSLSSFLFIGIREYPTPGNELLPTFGFCDVRESSKDMKQVVTNKHRFICEVSPHSLYQYTFIVTWFFMIFSTLIALLGFLVQVIDHSFAITCLVRQDENAR